MNILWIFPDSQRVIRAFYLAFGVFVGFEFDLSVGFGLFDLAGLIGGVGIGAGVGLTGFTPGLITASMAALRSAIAESISIFPLVPAVFLAFAVVAEATAALVRKMISSASLLNLVAISLRACSAAFTAAFQFIIAVLKFSCSALMAKFQFDKAV